MTRLRLKASVFVLWASLSATTQHVELRRDTSPRQAECRRQTTDIREQREEGERLRRWEGEKKSEIPGPDRIREDSVNKGQPREKLHSKFLWERFATAIKIDRIPLFDAH